MTPAPLTALVITRNEGIAIKRCLDALDFCDQVLVIDSGSRDDTATIARACGATVIDFDWNGEYPKKKQWGMERPEVRNDWVLHLDADEIVPPDLATEITSTIRNNPAHAAYETVLEYHFCGQPLRHGHKVVKRNLLRKSKAKFPEVGDLLIPGITEVEGHYQPEVVGRVGRLASPLVHDDPDPIASWVARHNRYSDWEAHLSQDQQTKKRVRSGRSKQGQVFERLPAKPLVFFVYTYVIRGGFRDGRAGLDYAISLAWYYWLTSLKRRELQGWEQKGPKSAR